MYPIIDFVFGGIYTFPIILLIAFVVCVTYVLTSHKYNVVFFRSIFNAIPLTLCFAAIGGKALFAFTQFGTYGVDVIRLLNGFVFLGGFSGAMLGLKLYCHRKNYSFLEYSDIAASILPLGQSIGRIGCYLNGCCYGIQYDGFLSVIYPVGDTFVRVVPTWFIESGFCLLLFLFFHSISKRKRKGFYTAVYMIAYSVFRFFLEWVRGDEIRGLWRGVSTSQILCVIMLVFGIVVLVYSNKKCGYSIIIRRA